MRKTEFNLEKQMVYIYFHYGVGKITAHSDEHDRNDLIGKAKLGDMDQTQQDENESTQK